MTNIKAILALVLSCLILASQLALAQRGRIRFLVVDTKGTPIEKVKITLRNDKAVKFMQEIFTDSSGLATCLSLKPDVYRYAAEKDGYISNRGQVKADQSLTRIKVTLSSVAEVMEEAQADDPRYLAIDIYNEAVESINAKEFEKALSLLKDAVALDPNLFRAYHEMGKIYYLTEKFEEAVAHLNRAIAFKKDFVPSLKLLAASHDKMGNKEKAAEYLKKVKELTGPTGIDKFNEATKFINERNFDAAIPLLREAIQRDPKLADAYYELGMALLNKGDSEGAAENLSKYLELAPDGDKAPIAQSVLKTLRKTP